MATEQLTINTASYRWTARTLRLLQAALKVTVKVHPDSLALAAGEILVCNYFAPYETFIPQYLLYEATGDYCRTVADPAHFTVDTRFARYLKSIGAVPEDLPEKMVFLVMEVLRGRRLLLFPLAPYERPNQHATEAAIIALAVAACRRTLRTLGARHNQEALTRWSEFLDVDPQTLLHHATRHTRVLALHLSVYPIQIPGNRLAQGTELFHRRLSRRLRDELIIEGNASLRHTDVELRVGPPLDPEASFNWWEARLFRRLSATLESPMAALPQRARGYLPLGNGLYRWVARRTVPRLRDQYLNEIQQQLSLNLCHLTAVALRGLWRRGTQRIPLDALQRLLYLMLKAVQQERLPLHRSLRDPAEYRGLLAADCPDLSRFLESLKTLGLLQQRGLQLHLQPALDQLRPENPLSMYAQEAASLKPVQTALQTALGDYRFPPLEPLIRYQLDDERRQLAWLRREFSHPRYRQLPVDRSRMADPTPFLLRPKAPRPLGILLIHGVLSSPAELRSFGRELCDQGFPVYGVRLAGHGTSPWDLQNTTWEDWLDTVRRGYRLLASISERVALVGFASGGSLALLLGAELPPGLVGIAAVNTPLAYRIPALRHLPLVSNAQQLIRPDGHGSAAFLAYQPANPRLSYHHIPLKSLQQLRQLRSALLASLIDIQHPVLLLQGDQDPVVDPGSARQLLDELGTERKRLISIPSRRHSIIHEAVGETRPVLSRYLTALAGTVPPPVVPGRVTG